MSRRGTRIPYRLKPSAGFALVLAIILATVVFFAWGLSPPTLEMVWRMDTELGMGRRPPLSPREFKVLQRALLDYPKLAASLLEDKHAGLLSANDNGRVEGSYAYLIRPAPDTGGRLEVVYAGSKKKGAVAVGVRTAVSRHHGLTSRKEPFLWQLPNDGPFPQLVEVKLAKAALEKKDKKRRHPVQINLRETP
ncbi:hypothetical protein ACFL6C_07900 [Myxococcota bacterium]